MLKLCKSCLGYNALDNQQQNTHSDFDLIQTVKSPPKRVGILKIPKPSKYLPEDEKVKGDDDSGVDEYSRLEQSSRDDSLDNIMIDGDDRVQLTVSSVNTILEELPETDDELEGQDLPPLKNELKIGTLVELGGIKEQPTTTEGTKGPRDEHMLAIVSANVNPRKFQRQISAPGNQNSSNNNNNNNNGGACASANSSRASSRERIPPPAAASVIKNRTRDRSPVVSFNENPVIVVQGCDGGGGGTKGISSGGSAGSKIRQRSRSDATKFKFRSPSSSISSNNSTTSSGTPATGTKTVVGKIAWLRERRGIKNQQTLPDQAVREQPETTPNDPLALFPDNDLGTEGRDGLMEEIENQVASAAQTQALDPRAATTTKHLLNRIKSAADIDKPLKKMRPRTKSDKFERVQRKKIVADVSKTTAFDWPLGRLGKLRQKYKGKENLKKTEGEDLGGLPEGRSASAAALTSLAKAPVERHRPPAHHHLKRRHSERHKDRSKSVAFESSANEGGGLAASLWSASVKFFAGSNDKGGKGGRGGHGKSGGRRRHLTDPDSCK